MKKSSQVMLLLVILFLSGVVLTDHMLVINYAKIDLKDPYKNFGDIAVKPFKALIISGGDSYGIQIKKGDSFNVKLLDSRRTFFRILKQGDTLSLRFDVASRSPGQAFDAVNGLIITVPLLSYIHLGGTRTAISGFQQDSLIIEQGTQARTVLTQLTVRYLSITGSSNSLVDCQGGNIAEQMVVNLSNTASVLMKDIRYHAFSPDLKDASTLVLDKTGLTALENSLKNP
jgi:hypothetical protein